MVSRLIVIIIIIHCVKQEDTKKLNFACCFLTENIVNFLQIHFTHNRKQSNNISQRISADFEFLFDTSQKNGVTNMFVGVLVINVHQERRAVIEVLGNKCTFPVMASRRPLLPEVMHLDASGLLQYLHRSVLGVSWWSSEGLTERLQVYAAIATDTNTIRDQTFELSADNKLCLLVSSSLSLLLILSKILF